jgi:hypothetical protein
MTLRERLATSEADLAALRARHAGAVEQAYREGSAHLGRGTVTQDAAWLASSAKAALERDLAALRLNLTSMQKFTDQIKAENVALRQRHASDLEAVFSLCVALSPKTTYDPENIAGALVGVLGTIETERQRHAETLKALAAIAEHPHQQYDHPENGAGSYGTGCADGHRCAAVMAKTAIDMDAASTRRA